MIYLCANLFSKADQEFNTHLVRLLRARGWEVFAPQEQAYNEKARRDTEISPQSIFLNDTVAVMRANAMFVLLDGPDIGSGVAFELGVFWTLHRQFPDRYWGCVGLWTDIRQDGEANNVAYRSQKAYINQFCVGGIEDMGTICRSPEDAVEETGRLMTLKESYSNSLSRRVSLPEDLAFQGFVS